MKLVCQKEVIIINNDNFFIAIASCIVIVTIISFAAFIIMPRYLFPVQTNIKINYINTKTNYLEHQESSYSKKYEVIENHMEANKASEIYVSAEPIPAMQVVPRAETNKAPEIYVVTAYDLSIQSCGKPIGHPWYGITATGYSLVGHTWYTARVIAVDPRVIPLGSKVLVEFLDDRFKQFDGIYTARDTGGAIKGNIIDIFLGDFNDNNASRKAIEFGRRQAHVTIIN